MLFNYPNAIFAGIALDFERALSKRRYISLTCSSGYLVASSAEFIAILDFLGAGNELQFGFLFQSPDNPRTLFLNSGPSGLGRLSDSF